MTVPSLSIQKNIAHLASSEIKNNIDHFGRRRPILVIGDKFQDFFLGKDSITISQLRGLLDFPAGIILCEPLLLIPGQGLGEDDIESVLARSNDSSLRDHLDFSLWHRLPRRAEHTLSHKRRTQNTLISMPRGIGEDVFELDLLIDENCELMSDHQTGLHLQGMILVEAARQAFLVVTEVFFLPQDGTKFYFIFNNVSADYKRFAFPIATRLVYRVRERDVGNAGPRFVVDVLFEQAGAEVAVVSGSFTVVKSRSVSKIEQSLAKETIKNHFAAMIAGDAR